MRVFVATTEGPSEVLRITPEAPEVRSVVCLNRTTATLPALSTAYQNFARAPSGVIEPLFGHPTYRVDVSARIDDGASWQLGVLIAHAAAAAGRLGSDDGAVVLATGQVLSDLTVDAVDHVADKLAICLPRLAGLAASGGRVTALVPTGNRDEAARAGAPADQPRPDTLTVAPVADARHACSAVGLVLPAPRRAGRRRSTPALALGATAAGVLMLAVAAGLDLPSWRPWAVAIPSETVTPVAGASLDRPEAAPAEPAPSAPAEIAADRAAETAPAPRTPDPALLVTLSALRAPAGHVCAEVIMGQIAALATDIAHPEPGRFAASAADGLCGLRYVFRNAGAVELRLSVAVDGASRALRFDRDRPEGVSVPPGEAVTWTITHPRRARSDLAYRIRVTTEPALPDPPLELRHRVALKGGSQ